MIRLHTARLAGLAGLAALCACSGPQKTIFSSDYPADSDQGIRSSVLFYWQHDHPDLPAPDVNVSQGVVNLTGMVGTTQERVDAVRDAWQPDAVREVVNELKVAPGPGQSTRKDDSLTIRIRNALIFDRQIDSTEYSIVTVGGTVYLMGIAKDQAELASVEKIAASVAGRGKVISYVRVRAT